MKNIILAVMLLISGTTFANASCFNGSCSVGPVRKAGVTVVNTTKRIVSAPVRAVKKVQTNRACRNCH